MNTSPTYFILGYEKTTRIQYTIYMQQTNHNTFNVSGCLVFLLLSYWHICIDTNRNKI
jgi:hypothetical protein